MKRKPVVLIDFDTVVFKKGRNFASGKIPPLTKKLARKLEQLRNDYKLYIYTKTNLILALKWAVENKLDKNFSGRIVKRKCCCKKYIFGL